MARPNKATVEYFPLVCQFGDSIQAIENIYGNDGFIVWVKLLQKLGRTENHFIDVRTNTAWKLFYSIFKLDEVKVKNILDTLAELSCIDSALWKYGIIYSQNFVNGIADAYRKRKIDIMQYEDILALVGVSGGSNPQYTGVSSGRNPVSGVGNPQSKLNKTKLNEIKKNVVVDSNQRIEIVSKNEATTTTDSLIPTLEEVRAYAKERGNKANADKFHAHYEGKKWEIKGEPITDWKAAFRYWEQNERKTTENIANGVIPPAQRPEFKICKSIKLGEGIAPDEVDSELFQQLRKKAKKRI